MCHDRCGFRTLNSLSRLIWQASRQTIGKAEARRRLAKQEEKEDKGSSPAVVRAPPAARAPDRLQKALAGGAAGSSPNARAAGPSEELLVLRAESVVDAPADLRRKTKRGDAALIIRP